jgi:hypothetical protein
MGFSVSTVKESEFQCGAAQPAIAIIVVKVSAKA